MAAPAKAGLSFSRSRKPAPTARTPGVVDLGDLERAFPILPPEIASSIDKLRFTAHYDPYEAGWVELDNLTRTPNLTNAQTTAVNEAIEHIEQVIAVHAKPTR